MASVKGGSGKTVLAATFGALLSAMGKRVLLVDTDAATNGLSLLYLDETLAARDATTQTHVQLFGTFEIPERMPTSASFVPLPTGVDLVPATMGFFNTEEVEPGLHAERLGAAVARWREEYDYIILDAQAGSDVYAAVSMKLSDRVVIVSEYDPLSAAGVERLKAIFPKELAYERTWVLLNKMLPELVQSYSDFMEVARYLRPIPWDPAVVRAYSRRSLALDLEHGNEHTVAVIGTLRSLLPPADAEELDRWVEARASEIRIPLRQQAQDLAEQLKGLDRLEGELFERSSASSRELILFSVFVASALVALEIEGKLPLIMSIGLALAALGVAASILVLRKPYEAWKSPDRADFAARRLRLESQLSRLEMLVSLEDERLVARQPNPDGEFGSKAPESPASGYVRGPGSDVWHWCRNCSRYPSVIEDVRDAQPPAELCNECRSKARVGNCRA